MTDVLTHYCAECDLPTEHDVLEDPHIVSMVAVDCHGIEKPIRVGAEMLQCRLCGTKHANPAQIIPAMREAQQRLAHDGFVEECISLNAAWIRQIRRIRSRLVWRLIVLAQVSILVEAWFGVSVLLGLVILTAVELLLQMRQTVERKMVKQIVSRDWVIIAEARRQRRRAEA